MSYVLEGQNEAQRLENQSKMESYSIEHELRFLELNDSPQNVLDAGCGTAIVSKELCRRFNKVKIDACDFSEIRIKQAADLSKQEGYGRINFFHSNLEQIKMNDCSYDVIFNRYVFQHLANPQKVANEFYRITKPKGQVYLIDIDGIFFNIHSSNIWFNGFMSHVLQHTFFDAFAGRKIPTYLKNAGFTNIKYDIETMQFNGSELEKEVQITKERLALARPMFVEIFKDKDVVDKFCDLYIQEMQKEENPLFYNRFIVQAQKK